MSIFIRLISQHDPREGSMASLLLPPSTQGMPPLTNALEETQNLFPPYPAFMAPVAHVFFFFACIVCPERSPEQYGLMSSVYSLSQIIGGLVLGALSDRIMSRRSVLLLSFMGSALSYGAIGLSSSLSMLVAGRVVVGLVKQVRAALSRDSGVGVGNGRGGGGGDIGGMLSVVNGLDCPRPRRESD